MDVGNLISVSYAISKSSWYIWKFLVHVLLKSSLKDFEHNLASVWYEWSSVQFCHSVMSNSLQPHGLQHTRPPCPSPTPRVYLNSCPLSQRCHPTISYSVVPFSSLPSIFTSIRVFSDEYVLRISWAKYWSFSFNISPSNEYSGLISFRMDWLDLLAVQGTFKSLLQHNSSKASNLWHSAFFAVQLSHPYMTTGKTIDLTRWTLLAKWCPCFLICCLDWS